MQERLQCEEFHIPGKVVSRRKNREAEKERGKKSRWEENAGNKMDGNEEWKKTQRNEIEE